MNAVPNTDIPSDDPPFGTVRGEHEHGLIVEISGRQADSIGSGIRCRYRRFYALWTWDGIWATTSTGSTKMPVGAPTMADARKAFNKVGS